MFMFSPRTHMIQEKKNQKTMFPQAQDGAEILTDHKNSKGNL